MIQRFLIFILDKLSVFGIEPTKYHSTGPETVVHIYYEHEIIRNERV